MAAPLVQLTRPSPRAPAAPAAPLRKPAWLRVQAPGGPNYLALKHLMRDLQLHTVCEEAHCPNIGECWEHRAATFMILGDVCTRNCAYCAVAHGTPRPLDPGEPGRLAEAVARMGLKHVVITSVDRDDLPHGGAESFAACVAEIRRRLPETSVEVLIPDFKGSDAALRIAVAARPDILNHNLETIERLYRLARPGGRYPRALELPRVGAGRARDGVRLTPTALRMATATAQPAKDETLVELQRRMLRQMLLVRRFEEKAAEAYALGKIGGFCHLYIGQEAVAAGSPPALRDDGYVLCSYRQHGQAPLRGVPRTPAKAGLARQGMGTAFERVAAVTDVVEHACSYDMAAELVNGMDALAVYGATERAAERARKTGHPTLLEVRTYRFMGHSMSDPLHGVYRTKEEVEEQKKRDPISQLALKLKEEGALDGPALDALDAEVRAVVEAAVQFADQSPDPDLAELTSHVLVE